jgi:hypothetical protein
MEARNVVAVGMGCFLAGVVVTRAVTSFSDGDTDRKFLQCSAENRALNKRPARFQEEPLPSSEPEPADPRTAPKSTDFPAHSTPTLQLPVSDGSASTVTDVVLKLKPGTSMRAAWAATLLGLDPGRQKLFEESYDRLLSKLRDAESLHSTVSRRGGQIEIHIPPFPDEGALLRQEWSGLLMSSLTPQEQDRYQELEVDRTLFPREIGMWDRYMIFQPEDLVWPKIENGNRYWPTFLERWTKPGEDPVDSSTRWPWGGPDAYRCYRHLLDPSDCKVMEE